MHNLSLLWGPRKPCGCWKFNTTFMERPDSHSMGRSVPHYLQLSSLFCSSHSHHYKLHQDLHYHQKVYYSPLNLRLQLRQHLFLQKKFLPCSNDTELWWEISGFKEAEEYHKGSEDVCCTCNTVCCILDTLHSNGNLVFENYFTIRTKNKYSRDTIDKESAGQIPGSVQDILYLTAVLNSCINPFIYGVYYYTENRYDNYHYN